MDFIKGKRIFPKYKPTKINPNLIRFALFIEHFLQIVRQF